MLACRAGSADAISAMLDEDDGGSQKQLTNGAQSSSGQACARRCQGLMPLLPCRPRADREAVDLSPMDRRKRTALHLVLAAEVSAGCWAEHLHSAAVCACAYARNNPIQLGTSRLRIGFSRAG